MDDLNLTNEETELQSERSEENINQNPNLENENNITNGSIK